ncbi:hypothetical protein PSEUBRA_000617 [Kalmanozyma brasiliensis GHG001]|uniref:uncharacterized protein n=1 Tax=Kalmanozyma brasiliensis (strain GHG001) TaxID=1365824 RepID=UPI002867FC76|nr:uncharacterized protein PSEUBRA_000617 [Kalmanozyma brasiliensis GHG001]EST10202.2 hypothetical protein PSEUBRA_000617 [Kalmanozyma brasiliensis GHG001]
MFLPPYLQRWLLLNAIRLLTIVSCTLSITATSLTLKRNFSHYSAPLLSPSSPYYPSTDIPTTFLGVFWSTLHHLSLCVVLFVVVLSELSLPIPLLHRLFKNTLPFLGPNWGTGFLGVLLVLVAADGLSRAETGRFAQVAGWVLASAGVANVAIGVVWRAKVKVVRSPMGWKKDVAQKLEGLAEAKRDAERVVDALPLPQGLKQGEKGAGLKSVVGSAGRLIASGLEKRAEKKEAREAEKAKKEAEKDVEKATQEATPPMAIFTPPLPSAIVSSRGTPLAATAPPVSSTTVPPAVIPPPLIVPPPAAAAHLRPRTPSTYSQSTLSSSYTLDMPPPPLAVRSATPPLKTVRFNPTPSPIPPATTIDSLAAHASLLPPSPLPSSPLPPSSSPKTVGVGGSKFLLLPPPLTHIPAKGSVVEGERSPSVLASLKAAMLEAQAKANAQQAKKSIYLGSRRWKAEYEGLADGEQGHRERREKDEKSEKRDKEESTDKSGRGEKERPYNFL